MRTCLPLFLIALLLNASCAEEPAPAAERGASAAPISKLAEKETRFVGWDPKTNAVAERPAGPRADEASVELETFVFVYPKDQETVVARRFKNYQEILAQTGRVLPNRAVRLDIQEFNVEDAIDIYRTLAMLNLVIDPDAMKRQPDKKVSIHATGTAAEGLFFVCLLADVEAEFQKPRPHVPGQLFLRGAEGKPVESDNK
jgi:hypothetical protein